MSYTQEVVSISKFDAFKFKREEILKKTNPIREKVFNRYELLLLEDDKDGYTSIKNVPTIKNGCQSCLKPNEIRSVCNICSKHICNRCVRNVPKEEGKKELITLCRRCNNIITDKLLELKWKSMVDSNKSLSTLYKEIKDCQNNIESHFPQFKGLIFSLISLFGNNGENVILNDIDDGKSFDIPSISVADLIKSTIKLHPQSFIRKLETSIHNLSSYKNSSTAYTRLISVIKSHFSSYIKSKRPDFQLLEKQFNNILSHKKIKRILEEAKWSTKLEQDIQKQNSRLTQKLSSSPSQSLSTSIPKNFIAPTQHRVSNEKCENNKSGNEKSEESKKEGEKFKIHRVWGKQ